VSDGSARPPGAGDDDRPRARRDDRRESPAADGGGSRGPAERVLAAVRARVGTVRARASATARIARWEVSRGVDSVDRRTAALGIVALVLAGGVAAATVAGGGVALDDGIYRVGVASDSPYHEVVAGPETPALAARSPDARLGEGIDVRIRAEGPPDGRFRAADSRKGQAALAALRSAVERHNDRLLAAEDNQTAAFPVLVQLRYEDRVNPALPGGATGAGGGGGGGDGPSIGGGDDGDEAGSGGGPLPVPGLGGGGGGLFGQEGTGTPTDISPPFPYASLVLAFAFLVPMNFVIQAYGSTILNERVNRRGELLLVAPIEPGDIVAGKTLPYLGALVATTVAIALAVGGGPVTVAAVIPIGLLFLSATFVGAMFARSFKELTFVTVAVSTFLTSYAFVPAVFTDVTPIALISPLTLVVRDLKGVGITLGQYAFSTGPVLFSAGVLFLVGAGVYREEDMFTQRPVPLKFLDALDARLSGRLSVFVVTALSIPFVFVAELLAIAVLFALPVGFSIPVMLVVIAVVEEFAKSLHVYAGFVNSRFDASVRSALTLGLLSGLGFFVGEKAVVAAQLVGLQEVRPLGEATFATAGVGVEAGPLVVAGLLLAPLALHVVTASISALGARKTATQYLLAVTVAVAVHAAYNLAVVVTLG
jgi:ABC-type Na+ efflux pump permease subunit